MYKYKIFCWLNKVLTCLLKKVNKKLDYLEDYGYREWWNPKRCYAYISCKENDFHCIPECDMPKDAWRYHIKKIEKEVYK